MPKIRLLVPREIEGTSHGVGAEVDVDDETAADLRANGAASLLSDEQAAAKEGHYSERVSRADAGEQEEEAPKSGKKK